jgi:gliding motility-associatede transport system auxiliary component
MRKESTLRNLMLGSGTAAGIVIFLAIIVAAQYVVLQHPKRWDLTGSEKYTLAPQSKKVLGEFKKKNTPIVVLAFYQMKDKQRKRVQELLDQYKYADSSFKYSFIDPDKDVLIAKKNKIDNYPTLVVKAGDKTERISTATEETVTNSLVKLLSTKVKKIYFLKGHGELSPTSTDAKGFSAAKAQIEKQNYKTGELVLLQSPEVPEDANVLVIAGPKIDPLDSELKAIGAYIKRGGKLFVLLNPFKTPKLAAFLKKYGFATSDDIVVDQMGKVFGGSYLIPLITTYIKSPITKDFTLATFFPESRSVTASKKPEPNISTQNLALTSQASWTINKDQLDRGNATFDKKTDVRGPISVMAMSTVTTTDQAAKPSSTRAAAEKTPGDDKAATKPTAKKGTGNESLKKARIVVTGSTMFASNGNFEQFQANRELFMNTISWLAEDEDLIAIRPKTSKAQPLFLTGSEPLVILLISVVFMPMAWVVAGIAVLLYRRRTVNG